MHRTHKIELQVISSPQRDREVNTKEYVSIDTAPKYRSMDISRLSNIALMEREAMEDLSLKRWREHLKHNNSVVSDVFKGQTVSKLTCTHCLTNSYNFEAFYILELSIPEGRDTLCLGDLITHFGKSDLLESFKWDCPKCKVQRQAKRSCQLYKLPPVLAICFKRFEYKEDRVQKNNALIEMNLSGEDLNPFELGGTKGVKKVYTPYFIVVPSPSTSTTSGSSTKGTTPVATSTTRSGR